MNEKIIIFDTTLRDGEQSPGASLNAFEKVEIARQLEKLNYLRSSIQDLILIH